MICVCMLMRSVRGIALGLFGMGGRFVIRLLGGRGLGLLREVGSVDLTVCYLAVDSMYLIVYM